MMAGVRFPKSLPDFDLGSRVINDPFKKLPSDIIYLICQQLPATDIPLFAKAS